MFTEKHDYIETRHHTTVSADYV